MVKSRNFWTFLLILLSVLLLYGCSGGITSTTNIVPPVSTTYPQPSSVAAATSSPPTTVIATPTSSTPLPATSALPTSTSVVPTTSAPSIITTPAPTTSFFSYTSKKFYYRISYPLYPFVFQVKDSDPTTVTIDNAAIGGIAVLVDKVPVNSTAKSYFDAISQGKKQQLPTWNCSNVTEISEDGAIVGYKYDYSNVVSNKNWIGKGMVYKKANLGFYVVYTTPEENWGANLEMATTCVDSFVPPKLIIGKYTNSKFGFSLNLPVEWSLYETNSIAQTDPALVLYLPNNQAAISVSFYVKIVASGTTAEKFIADGISAGVKLGLIKVDSQGAFSFSNGAIGYKAIDSMAIPGFYNKSISIVYIKGTTLYQFDFYDTSANVDAA
ncbi:MAG TPA: hypothetical protein VMB24_05890 [Dehalococcoidales bacterium]|nr:hypothetical protein [Dehalococcoidales bacterium]